jgi:predicted TIM-barrel fold metal-dependent hydrolase
MDAQIHPGQPMPVQEIDTKTDTRNILAHSRKHAEKAGYADWLIIDIDAHHVETASWSEIVTHIDDPVLRDQAKFYHAEKIGAPPYGLNGDLGLRYQDVGGRIPHQAGVSEAVDDKSVHRDVILSRRAMQAFALDYMVVFPTPMLFLGLHPQTYMEVVLCNAYNSWLCERVLPHDPGLKAMVVLPYNSPEEACKTVERFGDKQGVIGFSITSTRHKPVHANEYMRLYAMIEETGKPLGFHAGYHWQDPSLASCNSFLGMHALGFVWSNMVHMTNWVLNGIPERFPKLNSLWIESGLAWVPFLMQRLDEQFLMRQSEAPLLKRLPSEYMNTNCFYTSQPLEAGNMKAVECTFDMIKAESQLLFATDWPHFDFDSPRVIYDMPFLNEMQKRRILGLNAAELFGLEIKPHQRG